MTPYSLCYLKLRPFLAVSAGDVRWMPRLDLGWRRLSFGEWCQFYGIAPYGGSR